MNPITIDELRTVIALSDLPDEHLQWILDHSEQNEFEDGTIVSKKGEPLDFMWILVEGKLEFYMDVNGRLVHYFTFDNDTFTGGVGGLLPYSRMKSPPGNSYAVGKVRGLGLHKKYFQELEQLNPDFIQRLIGYMTERAKHFATTQLQHEKVNALGKLAAGIAHELNNPAAAINRISSELNKRLNLNFALTKELLSLNITPQIVQYVQDIVVNRGNNTPKKISALQRIEIEDEISDWLKQKGINNQSLAEMFAELDFSINHLETIYKQVGDKALLNVLNWLENLLSSEKIIKDLEEASNRISRLVGAIKSHVHMDRSNDLQPTNIHNDIENTLTLLGYKLREKNISLKKNYCEDFPEVEAYIGELNQVWTNIIDNAIYAMPRNGTLTITTTCNSKDIYVKIEDNGTGIPKDIISRIFDPFFTTKKVGDGTGIGLDIVQKVVKKHNGEIKVNSEPGKTEFKICLPISQKEIMKELSV